MAPALSLPDLRKPSDLFVHEGQGMGLGFLTQNLGNIKRPVDSFSKQLVMVAQGRPVCLRTTAAPSAGG